MIFCVGTLTNPNTEMKGKGSELQGLGRVMLSGKVAFFLVDVIMDALAKKKHVFFFRFSQRVVGGLGCWSSLLANPYDKGLYIRYIYILLCILSESLCCRILFVFRPCSWVAFWNLQFVSSWSWWSPCAFKCGKQGGAIFDKCWLNLGKREWLRTHCSESSWKRRHLKLRFPSSCSSLPNQEYLRCVFVENTLISGKRARSWNNWPRD